MTEEGLTKKRAKEIALRHRGAGYFDLGAGHEPRYTQSCPLCREHVPIWRNYPRSLYPPTAGELDRGLMDHLLAEYDDVRCPQVASVRMARRA